MISLALCQSQSCFSDVLAKFYTWERRERGVGVGGAHAPSLEFVQSLPRLFGPPRGCRAGASSPHGAMLRGRGWGQPWPHRQPGSARPQALGLSAAPGSPAAPAPDADPGPPGRETHPATRVSLKPRDTGDNCSLQHLGCIQLALKGLQMVQSQR